MFEELGGLPRIVPQVTKKLQLAPYFNKVRRFVEELAIRPEVIDPKDIQDLVSKNFNLFLKEYTLNKKTRRGRKVSGESFADFVIEFLGSYAEKYLEIHQILSIPRVVEDIKDLSKKMYESYEYERELGLLRLGLGAVLTTSLMFCLSSMVLEYYLPEVKVEGPKVHKAVDGEERRVTKNGELTHLQEKKESKNDIKH